MPPRCETCGKYNTICGCAEEKAMSEENLKPCPRCDSSAIAVTPEAWTCSKCLFTVSLADLLRERWNALPRPESLSSDAIDELLDEIEREDTESHGVETAKLAAEVASNPEIIWLHEKEELKERITELDRVLRWLLEELHTMGIGQKGLAVNRAKEVLEGE